MTEATQAWPQSTIARTLYVLHPYRPFPATLSPGVPPKTTSHQEGQGELRGKQHRNSRCRTSAAYEDYHLRRQEDGSMGLKRLSDNVILRREPKNLELVIN
jgi:hypothetical protein